MIKVHHLNNSRSHRILWMLEELKQRYEIVAYQRDPKTMLAPPELKKIHPLGKSPVIEDGDLILAESGAIIEYLSGKYGNGAFTPIVGTKEHIQYLHWMHFAEGTAMLQLILKLYLSRIPDAPAPLLERVDGQIGAHLAYMNTALSTSPFFAGENFSAADVQMSFSVLAASARSGLSERFSHLMRWLENVRARPAFIAAEARGGSLKFA